MQKVLEYLLLLLAMLIKTEILQDQRSWSILLIAFYILKASVISHIGCSERLKTDTAQQMKSEYLKCLIRAWQKCQIRRLCLFRASLKTQREPALRALWRVQDLFLPRFRHSSALRATAIREEWQTVLTTTGLQCLPPCLKNVQDIL